MPLDKELIEMLACPQCKGDLVATEKEDGLICQQCAVIFPVRDDIPILLIDEARPWNPSPSNESS